MNDNKTYCIVAVANPYMELRLCACDEHGTPVGRKVYVYSRGFPTGKTRREYLIVGVHNPAAGYHWMTRRQFHVVDATPRSYDDASEIARKCPAGKYGNLRGADQCASYIATPAAHAAE